MEKSAPRGTRGTGRDYAWPRLCVAGLCEPRLRRKVPRAARVARAATMRGRDYAWPDYASHGYEEKCPARHAWHGPRLCVAATMRGRTMRATAMEKSAPRDTRGTGRDYAW